jgi:GxxExxY protein
MTTTDGALVNYINERGRGPTAKTPRTPREEGEERGESSKKRESAFSSVQFSSVQEKMSRHNANKRKRECMKVEPGAEMDGLAHEVIGAAIEVHRNLGPGFLENVYEEAMWFELGLRSILAARQVPVSISYKNHPVGEGRLDFLVSERLIVELKAVETLAPIHKAQVISYLKSTGLCLGLLINFNVLLLRDGIQRVVLTPS